MSWSCRANTWVRHSQWHTDTFFLMLSHFAREKNKRHKDRKTHTSAAANRMWLFNLSFTRSITSSSVPVCLSVVPCPTSSSSHPRLCCHGSKSCRPGRGRTRTSHLNHLIPTLWMCFLCAKRWICWVGSLFLYWVSVVRGCPSRRTMRSQFVGSSQSRGKAKSKHANIVNLNSRSCTVSFFVLLSLFYAFSALARKLLKQWHSCVLNNKTSLTSDWILLVFSSLYFIEDLNLMLSLRVNWRFWILSVRSVCYSNKREKSHIQIL